ncbi:hypothetical protein BCR43DRAFT_490483 [Syncephalastrum racemosum]|uniref:Glutathione S-transferase n=1 Tax=Syncephalastrum racemosum TaxID=13706 RepID=A0A1X2HFX4_SYNRA|nr:hypothetical protein BCR43DRAFT_490483 [Syncephalastrum racemosum]
MTSSPTVVGAHMSTFTRTIVMALQHLGVAYEWIDAAPHSDTARQYNPFGKIPSFVTQDGHTIYEALAIRTFIEQKWGNSLSLSGDLAVRVNQWTSVVSDYVFKDIIFGVCKPRFAMEEKQIEEGEIKQRLQGPVEKACHILSVLEGLFSETKGPWLCGAELSWADLYLFPCLADVYSTPEAEAAKRAAPQIWEWFQHFEKLDIAQKTYRNTVAYNRAKI